GRSAVCDRGSVHRAIAERGRSAVCAPLPRDVHRVARRAGAAGRQRLRASRGREPNVCRSAADAGLGAAKPCGRGLLRRCEQAVERRIRAEVHRPVSPGVGTALLSAAAAVALLTNRLWVVVLLTAALLVVCLRAPASRRWP